MSGDCTVCGKQPAVRSSAEAPRERVCTQCHLTLFLLDELPHLDLDEFDLEPAVVAEIPRALAVAHQAIAVNRAGSTLIVAIAHPTVETLRQLNRATELSVEPVVASLAAIRRAWAKQNPPTTH